MFHSTTGLIHLLAALVALFSGSLVLLRPKGGLFHKRAGYAYLASMLLLNLTALLIYHLFGRFGPFHWLAVLSLLCLTGGMVPALLRSRITRWIYWHYYFMNWSVVGLYAAFWAETLTRTLPVGQFWPLVLLATMVTTITGSVLIRRHAARLLATGPATRP
ncbi:DUF2306 domain-containing protein [Fibrella forsythiae]|uniref:DUF2306 domain-containing protein n=1 Tax=Fibrella forsythiae TaxID=2817061 RepID=A0ABS3JSW0_9BACT|nr:DUF2306 domain-containing protein [Fibrella forsythiae]MBO0953095.1 DUF2306 domain-containing protein [Fibrella forsythiae]